MLVVAESGGCRVAGGCHLHVARDGFRVGGVAPSLVGGGLRRRGGWAWRWRAGVPRPVPASASSPARADARDVVKGPRRTCASVVSRLAGRRRSSPRTRVDRRSGRRHRQRRPREGGGLGLLRGASGGRGGRAARTRSRSSVRGAGGARRRRRGRRARVRGRGARSRGAGAASRAGTAGPAVVPDAWSVALLRR